MATVKLRITDHITACDDCAFVRGEFASIGSDRQVARALQELIAEGALIRMGYGVYAHARKSSMSGKMIPCAPTILVGLMALEKLGVPVGLGKEARANRDGLSTQVPMLPIISVGRSRVRRKIGFQSSSIIYETD